MSSNGINGLKQSLKATNEQINIAASNLTRSQIPGSQEIRATLTGTDTVDLGGGRMGPGPGVTVSATTADFGQGSLRKTNFTTDLAINGPGFFVLFDAKGQQFYTRRGDFHFDAEGFLVNNDGLYVASFDPKTGKLEKTSVEINAETSDLGLDILEQLKTNGNLSAPQLASALSLPQADINDELARLKVAGFVNSFNHGSDTFFESNLGKVGDLVSFDQNGFVVNASRDLRKGNQIALALFVNPQGLQPSQYGGTVFSATDAAAPRGIPEYGRPGDARMGLGSIEGQALEESTSTVTASVEELGILSRTFSSTAAAMKIFLSAWDDLINVFRAA